MLPVMICKILTSEVKTATIKESWLQNPWVHEEMRNHEMATKGSVPCIIVRWSTPFQSEMGPFC
jgi:hypothetical protein